MNKRTAKRQACAIAARLLDRWKKADNDDATDWTAIDVACAELVTELIRRAGPEWAKVAIDRSSG